MAKLIQPLLDVEAAAATFVIVMATGISQDKIRARITLREAQIFAIADGYSAEVFVKPGTEAGKERGRSKLKEA